MGRIMEISSQSTHRLPVRLTPFVGRQADLERILDLIQLPSVRLVTILGAGGVGKTRLAIETAGVLHHRFHDGAVFISLAQLSTMDEFLPALAGTLHIQLPREGDLQQTVLEHLATRQLLIVLDNFEQLIGEAALISNILANSPQIKILLTSREKLDLEAETLYHLSGLQLPPQDTLGDIQNYGAISLFLQKAAQVCNGFSLTTENTPAIVKICQLVDGNALGILLAAAWLEYFSPDEIAAEISHNLDFLSRELRDAEPRHFGMRAVFDSSFNRLDERLQAVFRKLAVFRGGFDLPAAKTVAGADLRTLIALVDKSLLTRDPHTSRYELHELLRQYAWEQLEAAGEQENILSAYTDYYISTVCSRESQMISSSQMKALDEIQYDFDNIRYAFSRVIKERNFTSAGVVIPGLYAFCDMRSRFYEGETIFRLASEGLTPYPNEPHNTAFALALLSWYDMRTYIEQFESFEQITLQAEECLEQAIATDNAQAIAACMVLLGAIAEDQKDFRTALQKYKEGMGFYPPMDDFYWVIMRIGLCHLALLEYPEAIHTFQTCLQRGKETGERVKTGWSLLNIGDTFLLQGDPTEAEQYLEQARDLFKEVGTKVGVLWSNYSLSRAAIVLGDHARGKELAESAGEFAHQLHSASWIAKTERLQRQLDPLYSQIPRKTGNSWEEPLSPRELEVLQLLKSDLSGPAIAEQLVVSLNTVRYHTKNIYRKLGAGTRLEAIQRAKEIGL